MQNTRTDFNELKIWQKGYELLMEVYDSTDNFPKSEKYALTDQLRRSANSIIANIAESHGRYFYADKVRVLFQARGELLETRSHLRVAFGRKYIDKSRFEILDREYQGLAIGMNAYISSLKKNSNREP